MKYITHPLIKPESLEERQYQLSIAVRAMDGNTMVVLPTGLGKTAVALLSAAMRIKSKGGRVLMMAPTKPLVDQHLKMFQDLLIEPEGDNFSGFAMFTGNTKTSDRKKMWEESRMIFATPQVIKNDIIAGRYSLADVSLLIVDECHRAVGNYAYVFIAQEYMKTANSPIILAMTASPGSKDEKVMEVCQNLSIEIVETRNEEDDDVRPYIHEREVHYVEVDLPPELEFADLTLKKILQSRLDMLSDMGYIVPKENKLTMKALNGINAHIQRNIQARNSDAYLAASIHAELMKIRHAISLAESQGSLILKGYLNKLAAEGMSPSGTKASQRLCRDPLFVTLIEESDKWESELLPKFQLTYEIVNKQLMEFPDSRVIIFANFRDTVGLLTDYLNDRGIESQRFIGQASKDSSKGLSQKKQIETLCQFREGEFRVLVATSVGEEGLDVPSTDLVLFYESVPSEIRSIQRKGRTGRHGSGSIVVLVTKGTSDETFRYVSRNREKSMKKGIGHLANIARINSKTNETLTGTIAAPTKTGQISIDSFVSSGPAIIADDREASSGVVEHLHRAGVDLTLERLPFGDYAIGDRILVERKTTRDFMDTLVERDLLGQIKNMADAVLKPVLIIEGTDLYSQRNINPNAVKGALSAIAIGMGVSIFYTENAKETADMLFVIAKREDSERGTAGKPHFHKSYKSKKESQEYIMSSFPGLGLKNARILLTNFGTLKNIMNADEDELKAVLGIGEKTASAIYEISRKIYE
ncbi:DEAD/DEAH box helicase [Methanoplanus sp. FWC-SCC4]|uniref:DEAD/DEAH box helicase n=1 Tax=Methanochimaera problematica TaxID=2609417 RepID=A0AA97I3A3_9EURY|nr:DEAD/DEAH box helicase [Methanoplanus sp. FWC-SCC4]WOF16483.1 DEAD/DEAH box helicase [Methanoplanus sp. FWC-SCC4]